jgi:hypothetical protein
VNGPNEEQDALRRAADSAGKPAAAAPRPELLVTALALGQVVVWTLAPTLAHSGLPVDVLEGYAVGRYWLLGDLKHPSLPWWLLEASWIVTGAVGWPAYLLSAVSIAATYGLVFAIGRRLLDAERALAGTLLLTGVLYFSVVTPEFNHNVLQMPLWAAIILGLLTARSEGSIAAWIGLGLLGAIGLYAKLSTAILLVTAALFILADRDCRRQLAGPGPWLGFALFALLASPLVHWLLRTDFAAFDYAAARAAGSAGSAGAFLVKQVASSLGLYALVIALCVRRNIRERLDWPSWQRGRWTPLQVLVFLHVTPLALAVVGALLTGNGLKGSWGSAMLSLSGLLVVALAPRIIDAQGLRRLAAGAAVFILAVPALYAASVIRWDLIGSWPPRVAWHQRKIAERLEQIWLQRTGQPLRFVVGDVWTAGMVATFGRSRALPILDGNLALAPSVSIADLGREGALIVYGPGPIYPPQNLRWLVGERVDGLERFPLRSHEREVDGLVWYTILAPGSVIAPPPVQHVADRQRVPGRKRERPSQ